MDERFGLTHHAQVIGMAAVDGALRVPAQHAFAGQEVKVLQTTIRQNLVFFQDILNRRQQR